MEKHLSETTLKPAPRIAVGIVAQDDFDVLPLTIQSVEKLNIPLFVLNRSETEAPKALQKDPLVRWVSVSPESDGSTARNHLIDEIENEDRADWLLWLQSGERFDEETLDEFREFLRADLDRDSLYVMVVHRLAKSDGTRSLLDEETIEARLMPLKKGLRYDGRVRESLLPSAGRLMIALNAAPGRFLQVAEQDNEGRRHRARRSLNLLEQWEKEGRRIEEDLLAVRAESFLDLGDHLQARRDLCQLVGESKQPNLRLESYYRLWNTFPHAPVAPDLVTKLLVEAIDQFPVDLQLLTFMGCHLQSQGRQDLAVRSFETAIKFGQVTLDVWHLLHIGEIAVTNLATVHRLAGDYASALRVLETNRDKILDRSFYDRNLLELYIVSGQETKALDFASVLWGDLELDRMREVVLGACRTAAGDWNTAHPGLESAYTYGCRDVLCLKWYSVVLMSLRRWNEAAPILREWVEREPGNSEARSFLQVTQNPQRYEEAAQLREEEQRRRMPKSGAISVFKPNHIDEVVHEMIMTSGSTPGEKIQTGATLRERIREKGFDLEKIASEEESKERIKE